MATDIIDLFASGEDGVWFDPQYTSLMWTDTALTTPVSADGDLVAESWSRGIGPELAGTIPTPTILDGGFGANPIWTSGTATMSSDTVGSSASYPRYRFGFGLTASDKYEVNIQLSGDLDKFWSTLAVRLAGTGVSTLSYDSTTGVVSGGMVAAGAYLEFVFDGTQTFSTTIESISIRRIPDVIRQQSTSGSRPVYKVRSDGTAYLDYTGGKTISYTNSEAGLKFMHDGTGGSWICWLEWAYSAGANRYAYSAALNTDIGIRLEGGTAVLASRMYIRNGSGTDTVKTTGHRVITGSPVMHIHTYKNDGLSTDFSMRKDSGVTELADVTTTEAAPSSSNASAPLAVQSTFGGKEYDVIFIDRVLTSNEMSDVYDLTRLYIDYTMPSQFDFGFWLGGQSNMKGAGEISDLSSGLIQPLDGVFFYNKAEEFKLMYEPAFDSINMPIQTSPGYSPANPGYSPGLAIGKHLMSTYGKTSLSIPVAVGGTGPDDWDVESDIGDRTTLFGAGIYRYNVTIGMYKKFAILYSGHESDSIIASGDIDYVNGGVGTEYRLKLESLFNLYRKHMISRAPIFLFQLGTRDTADKTIHYAAGGEAQRQLEYMIPNVYLIPTHDLSRDNGSDDVHLSSEGQLDAGERMGQAIAQHLMGEAVNGTGPRLVSIKVTDTDEVTVTFNKEITSSPTDYGGMFRVYNNGSEGTVSSAVRGANTSQVVITMSGSVTAPVGVTYGHIGRSTLAARTDIVYDGDGWPAPVFGPLIADQPVGGPPRRDNYIGELQGKKRGRR